MFANCNNIRDVLAQVEATAHYRGQKGQMRLGTDLVNEALRRAEELTVPREPSDNGETAEEAKLTLHKYGLS